MITIKNIWQDDNKLRNMFSWLTRIGAGPKFGSMPIAWYQKHQCSCIDWLEQTRFNEFKCCKGAIYGRNRETESKHHHGWTVLIDAHILYKQTDKAIR